VFPLCLNSLISTARSEEVKDRHRHRHRQRQRHTADTGTGTGTGTGTDTVTAPTRSMAQSKSIIVNPKFLVLGLSIPRPLCSASPPAESGIYRTFLQRWCGSGSECNCVFRARAAVVVFRATELITILTQCRLPRRRRRQRRRRSPTSLVVRRHRELKDSKSSLTHSLAR
jgi:hypothetical protein